MVDIRKKVNVLREVVGVPVALVCYVIFVALIFSFCNWSFERPADWPYGIPIITALFSMGGACGVAEKISSSAGAKITAILIAAFWVLFVIADMTGTVNDFLNVLAGNNPNPDAADIIMQLVDGLLNAKIFAVTSCILASGYSK